MVRRTLVAAPALALAAFSCSPTGGSDGMRAETRSPAEITVFAASSLTEAFRELGTMLEDRRPGATVRFNLASSSQLAVQIVEGAPADVFASADPLQMDAVAGAGLVDEPVVFATNRLVVLVPRDNPAGISGPADLGDAGVKLVVAAPEVPAGKYARRALAKLGVRDDAEANVVSNEEDVKAVVAKVSLGEADAGIAYATDVTDDLEKSVRAFPFPERAGVLARYLIAPLSGAPNEPGAEAFVELVTGTQGRRVFQEHGFGLP
jgi:molybdate transport system substrate-binding protein